MQCNQHDSPKKKAECIKTALSHLLDAVHTWPVEPDFNTLQVFVHEGMEFTENELWFWAMTVGLKIKGKEKLQEDM